MLKVRYREVSVKKGRHVSTYSVPTGVSRVDTEKGWHGWQVRFSSEPTLNKFFTDKQYGSIDSALDVAAAYMLQNRRKAQPHKKGS